MWVRLAIGTFELMEKGDLTGSSALLFLLSDDDA